MEPLSNDRSSTWYWAHWKVCNLAPYPRAWGLAYRHLWFRFDGGFIGKDK